MLRARSPGSRRGLAGLKSVRTGADRESVARESFPPSDPSTSARPVPVPVLQPVARPSVSALLPWVAGLLLWMLAAAPSWAQVYSFRNYAQSDGLQGLSITTLFEDADHVVWAGTELGLHRYDRERFHRVDEESGIDSNIAAIAADAQGRMWVGSFNGLYLRTGDGFLRIDAGQRRLSVDLGNSIVAYRDGVLVASGQRLVQVRPDQQGDWKAGPLELPGIGDDERFNALFAHGDSLWMGCGGMLCRLDGQGVLQRLGPDDGVPADRWVAFLADRRGTLWVRGIHHVLSRARGERRFRSHPAPPGDAFSVRGSGTNMVIDAKGRLLTRSDEGLLRWEGSHWRSFGSGLDGGVASNIGPMLVDHAGRLWIGTHGLGIQRWLGYDQIRHWDASQGLAMAPVWSIIRTDEHHLLVGSDGGGNLLDPASGRVSPWQAGDGKPLKQVLRMARRADGTIWLAEASGRLLRREPGDGATRVVATLPATMLKLAEADDRVLWIATRRGLYGLPAGETTPRREPQLPDAVFNDLAFDGSGRLWAVGSASVFRRIDGQWHKVETRAQLPSGKFTRISVGRDGSVWLAMAATGLWRGTPGADGTLALQRVDDPQISRIMPYVLRHDSRGWLWVGSSLGIDLYRDGRWVRVTQNEGLLWDDTSEDAFFEDDDGSVWIGNSKGVSQITDPQGLFAPAPLEVAIGNVRRGAGTVANGQRLAWGDAPLEVDLMLPGSVAGPDRTRFRYRLRGMQWQWSTSAQGHLTYNLSAPGDYLLEVQALDEQQRDASAIDTLAFTLLPPWWRSPLAWLLYLLAGVALILLLVRWRTRHLSARERELARLVAERTAELERDKAELEAARTALSFTAHHDELTTLLNRRGILQAMQAGIAATRLDRRPLAVVLIDLDHFKQINDRHGHLVGDAVLARVGRRLNAGLRESDRVGRYGGEELLALLPGLMPDAIGRLDALHRSISATPFIIGEVMLQVTCSIGVAWYRDGETVEQLLARADEALYRAKHRGRNRIEPETPAASA